MQETHKAVLENTKDISKLKQDMREVKGITVKNQELEHEILHQMQELARLLLKNAKDIRKLNKKVIQLSRTKNVDS